MPFRSHFLLFFLLIVVTLNAQDSTQLRLNQIQIIASHNSYKKKPNANVYRFLLKYKNKLGEALNPEGIDYGHLPFDSQFTNYGIRGLEIDIYNDPKGGLFYKRKINAFVKGNKQKSGIEELKKPGFKILHIKDIDYETNYYTFKESLLALKKWSDENPTHLPLFINIESKGDGPGDANGFLRFIGFKRSLKFDQKSCDSMDAEIKNVFGQDLKNILTPDRLRGNFATLNQMATQNGWPLLSQARGKIIFILEGQAERIYLNGHDGLQGRTMFVYAEPGTAECAFVIKNNPINEDKKIIELVQQGYVVRTRADGETVESRKNDNTCKNAAFASGAQIVSTDYYKPDLGLSIYCVRFENGEAGRKNPINAADVQVDSSLK